MINLLIVDDERHVVDWLYELFTNISDESEMEYECYRSYNSDEALNIFSRYKVDVLLSDIYMPGMSGLEMLDVVRIKHPNCHVIFLTGHSEFEDIYRATRYSNVRFLSKIEGDKAIVDAVAQAANDGIEARKLIDQKMLENNMLNMLSQRELLTRMLLGVHDPHDITEERFSWYKVPLIHDQPVNLLLGRITDVPADFHPAARADILNHICLLFVAQFSHRYTLVQIDYKSSLLVWLLQTKEDFNADSSPMHRSMLEDFAATCYDRHGVGLSFLLCEKEVTFPDISKLFSQVEDSIGFLLGQERGVILTSNGEANDALPPAGERSDLRNALRALSSLQVALEQSNRNNANSALNQILPVLASFNSRYDLQAAELYFGIVNVLLGCINRLRIGEDIAFYMSLGKIIIWLDFPNWTAASDYFRELCDVVIEILENKVRFGGDVVKRVTDFIDRHLSEDLSLTHIGECINYNPAYLSRVFKRVTGKNISTVISERRLSFACYLLRSTDKSVSKIARRCGIENSQYFATVFRKSYGITPQEYRTGENSIVHTLDANSE